MSKPKQVDQRAAAQEQQRQAFHNARDANREDKNNKQPPVVRQTYTIAELPVSSRTFKEIYDKLLAAGYTHTFDQNNTRIDMTGIAITEEL